jgi:hypothetical protein
VYPAGTGATIEGPNNLKLNQFLAPQKKRLFEQYVPMDSVDPVRFKTQEQEIARKQLNGSERILYPFRSNKLLDIFPPDPYRVNITGNPSKFGGMVHPIAHRNTGAIDLVDTDFINWKEGVDLTLQPGAAGDAAYLSRALHAPPRDGLDAPVARVIVPSELDELHYYDSKKPLYKNKRQLLYRDPITGTRKYVNLPEYPNSIESIKMREEADAARNASMASRLPQSNEIISGNGLMQRQDLLDLQEDQPPLMEDGPEYEEEEMDDEDIGGGYAGPKPKPRIRERDLALLTADEADALMNTDQSPNYYVMYFRKMLEKKEPGAVALDKVYWDVYATGEDQNFGPNDKAAINEFVESVFDPQIDEAYEQARMAYIERVEGLVTNDGLSYYLAKDLVQNYITAQKEVVVVMRAALLDGGALINNNSQNTVSKSVLEDTNITKAFENTIEDADQSLGRFTAQSNNLDRNEYKEGEALNATNDHHLVGWDIDRDPGIAAQDLNHSSTEDAEEIDTEEEEEEVEDVTYNISPRSQEMIRKYRFHEGDGEVRMVKDYETPSESDERKDETPAETVPSTFPKITPGKRDRQPEVYRSPPVSSVKGPNTRSQNKLQESKYVKKVKQSNLVVVDSKNQAGTGVLGKSTKGFKTQGKI